MPLAAENVNTGRPPSLVLSNGPLLGAKFAGGALLGVLLLDSEVEIVLSFSPYAPADYWQNS